jgi:hypothetical protein
MNVGNAIPWLAFFVSVVSAFFAGAAFWISREKLRLDLYNRRFDVYRRTLDFYHALHDWSPTEAEKAATSLQDSPELRNTQRAFIKASREAQFLFDDESKLHRRLEQMHEDMMRVIGFKRDVAPALRGQPAEDATFERSLKRINEAIPLLEQGMSRYLDFHTLSIWNAFKMR